MEELSQNFGFLLYRKHLAGPIAEVPLRLIEVNDFAQVWLDGRYLGSRFRDDGTHPFPITIPSGGATLEILVENCGRINYGPQIGHDRKGIAGSVCLELQIQLDWEYWSLPLDSPAELQFGDFSDGAATFHRGIFETTASGDTFLRRPGVKGLVWINGFNLGRYWNIGPTQTLYVPSPVLKADRNEIIVLELEKLDSPELTFQTTPDLGRVVTEL